MKKAKGAEPTNDQALRETWLRRVSREKKAHKTWHKQAEKSEEAYRDERQVTDDLHKSNPFPIWWSSVQITHAAIFAKAPKPDVRKRYADAGQADDRIAQAIQRGIEFTIDTGSFGDHAHRAVDDFLVGALGTGKVELSTETAMAPVIDPTTQQPMMGLDGEPLTQKVIKRQSTRFRHFHWSKFGWEPGKDWEACDWVRFEHDMTADEIKDRFGIVLDVQASNAETVTTANKGDVYEQTVDVQEIWDRKTKRQIFVSSAHDVPLEVNDDPLKLEGFFPCPRPMFLNIKGDELVPKPDYQFVQKQCENIQRLSVRIQQLTKNIKDVGFYDAQLAELGQLNNAADGTRIPIKNLAERLNAAGPGRMSFDAVVANQDNTDKANVLQSLVTQRDLEKNVLFETLGLADIVRGATVASETASAQTIKSQWANVRIGPKIQAVSFFFRDVFRIIGEIMAEHFEPDQLNKMSGMELQPQEFAVLKDDLNRTYAIDIETDSTLAQDDSEEKAQRLEMVKTMSDYLGAWVPAVQSGAIPAEMVKQMLLFVLRSFKYGRQLEDAINQMPDGLAQLQQLQQQMQQCQQQLEQAQQQNQQLQAEVQKNDAAKTARDDALAQADVEVKNATATKTQVEAQNLAAQTHAESKVAQSHEQAQMGMQAALQALAATAEQLDQIVPAIQQAAMQTAQRPKAIKVHRDETGKIAGAEVVG